LASVLAIVAVAVAVAVTGGVDTSSASANPPNILFIVTDDQRLDGTMVMMPKTLQWFADQGTSYSQAYITTPLCCPARSSIFTGQYSHNTGVVTNRSATFLDPRYTIERALHDDGYYTGLYGKYLNLWNDLRNPPYFDKFAVFDAGYKTFRANQQGTPTQVQTYSTTYIQNNAVQFLNDREANDSQPWFLYLAPYAPHLPATPDDQYANAPIPPFTPNPATWEADRSDKPPWVQFSRLDQADTINARDKQMRSLISVDNMVDGVFQTLQADDELSNTMAVFISDNGYMWGEHNLDAKNRPYLDSVRVPMYMRWPGHIDAGATDNRMVSNVDLTPTVMAATGLSTGGTMDGHNILDTSWARDRMLTEFVFQGDVPTWISLITPTSQYIENYRRDDPNSPSFREYYDLANDPYELDNVLSDGNSGNDPPTASLAAQAAADRVCAGSNCP
jgi:arylsulfatase A-like enzyme